MDFRRKKLILRFNKLPTNALNKFPRTRTMYIQLEEKRRQADLPPAFPDALTGPHVRWVAATAKNSACYSPVLFICPLPHMLACKHNSVAVSSRFNLA